jgi:hypothetical protein
LLEPSVAVEVTVAVVVLVVVVVVVVVGEVVAEVVEAEAAAVLAVSSESEQPASRVERANNAASTGIFTIGEILIMRFPR